MKSYSPSRNHTTVIKLLYSLALVVLFIPQALCVADEAKESAETYKQRKESCIEIVQSKFSHIQNLEFSRTDKRFIIKASDNSDKNKPKTNNSDLTKANRSYGVCLEKINGSTATDNACDTATTKLNEAIKEHKTSCTKAKMSKFGLSCESQVRKCTLCQSQDSFLEPQKGKRGKKIECEDFEEDAFQFGDTINAMLSGGGGEPKYRTEAGQKHFEEAGTEFARCPSFAGEGLSEIKKEVREEKKELREQLKLLEESQDDEQKAKSERQNKMEALQEQATKRIEDAKEIQKDIGLKMEQINQKFAEDLAKANAGLQAIEDAFRELALQAKLVYNGYRDGLAEVKTECHRAALTKQRALRAEAKQLINAGTYSAGGFNKLMKSVGLDRETKGRKQAEKFKKNCMRDSITKERILSLKRQKNSKLDEIKSKRLQLKNNEKQIRAQIAQIYSQSGPNMQRLITELTETQSRLKKDLDILAAAMRRATNEGMSKERTAQERIARAMMDYNHEKNRVEEKKNFLSLRDRYAKGNSEDGATSEAMGNYTSVLSHAETVISKCECCTGDDGACVSARSYLEGNDRKICRNTKSPSERSDAKIIR